MKDLRNNIAKAFRQMATDIEDMSDNELQDIAFLLQKIRVDIESGRYGKKYSDFNWRV